MYLGNLCWCAGGREWFASLSSVTLVLPSHFRRSLNTQEPSLLLQLFIPHFLDFSSTFTYVLPNYSLQFINSQCLQEKKTVKETGIYWGWLSKHSLPSRKTPLKSADSLVNMEGQQRKTQKPWRISPFILVALTSHNSPILLEFLLSPTILHFLSHVFSSFSALSQFPNSYHIFCSSPQFPQPSTMLWFSNNSHNS